jgi:hypothetical protein
VYSGETLLEATLVARVIARDRKESCARCCADRCARMRDYGTEWQIVER